MWLLTYKTSLCSGFRLFVFSVLTLLSLSSQKIYFEKLKFQFIIASVYFSHWLTEYIFWPLLPLHVRRKAVTHLCSTNTGIFLFVKHICDWLKIYSLLLLLFVFYETVGAFLCIFLYAYLVDGDQSVQRRSVIIVIQTILCHFYSTVHPSFSFIDEYIQINICSGPYCRISFSSPLWIISVRAAYSDYFTAHVRDDLQCSFEVVRALIACQKGYENWNYVDWLVRVMRHSFQVVIMSLTQTD